MESQKLFAEAALRYKDYPLFDLRLGEHLPMVRKAVHLINSQENLQKSIDEHINEYHFEEESGWIKLLYSRLRDVEDDLKILEDKHLIKITPFDYRT